MTARDPQAWMWGEACAMLARAERLQRRFFELGRSRPSRVTWEPPVDVFETPEELFFIVALPGVRADEVEVSLEGRILRVAGVRPFAVPPGGAIHRLEVPHGRFERHLELPLGRYEPGRRDLADGCLTLSFRKLS